MACGIQAFFHFPGRMEFNDFLQLDRDRVASMVRRRGLRVAVCPVNGTRRWFALEYGGKASFLDVILAKYLELIGLFFDLGIEFLLTPILGPDIMERGSAYADMVRTALHRITLGETFRAFYAARRIRVRFYGDYEGYFAGCSPEVLAWVEGVRGATMENSGPRLFWGMFAHDAVETLAGLSIRLYRETGRVPGREELVAACYGESVPPADLFIGMLPPAVFDFPLLDNGRTALYFTAAPTPYLDEEMLRRILYDVLFTRPGPDGWDSAPEEDWEALRGFYTLNRRAVCGLADRPGAGGILLPRLLRAGAPAEGEG